MRITLLKNSAVIIVCGFLKSLSAFVFYESSSCFELLKKNIQHNTYRTRSCCNLRKSKICGDQRQGGNHISIPSKFFRTIFRIIFVIRPRTLTVIIIYGMSHSPSDHEKFNLFFLSFSASNYITMLFEDMENMMRGTQGKVEELLYGHQC